MTLAAPTQMVKNSGVSGGSQGPSASAEAQFETLECGKTAEKRAPFNPAGPLKCEECLGPQVINKASEDSEGGEVLTTTTSSVC